MQEMKQKNEMHSSKKEYAAPQMAVLDYGCVVEPLLCGSSEDSN